MKKQSPIELFEKLFAFYGPQNWWPGEGFEIAIGAILTQNASWKNVELALENLRKHNLLQPEQIAAHPINSLKELIRPSGFYNQKALYLKNFSESWIKNPHPTREELLTIKGIGEETADSILLYLLNKAEFVIDAYTIRISQRLGFGSSNDKNFWKNFYQSALPNKIDLFNEFHALFVNHAKSFCTKKSPKCFECFLKDFCSFGSEQGKTNLF